MNRLLSALLVALLSTPVLAAAPVVPTWPTSALQPGQKALVRTVFVGDSIETFTAEIVGVLPGGRAEGDVILARATDPRVERTGVAQGMSGSPVYVDGHLIGALSSGWAFSKEPIFGITPIGEMLAVFDQPDTPTNETVGPTGVDPLSRAACRGLAWDDIPEAPVASGRARPTLALPLAASGFTPEALARVQDLFAGTAFRVVPGGRERAPSAAAPARLQAGSAVAVDVLRGDLNLSAIGTVTYVDGDRVLIFGHPFFQSGAVRLPLSTARITTIMGSLDTPFKLGVPGTPVGTATQDRRAAVAGRLGASPSLMPIRLRVSGGAPETQTFRFEAIDDRAMLPQLISTVVLNGMMESGGTGSVQTVDWQLEVWSGGRVLRLADRIAGEAPMADVAGALTAPVRFLAMNPFSRFRPDSLTISLALTPGRRQSTIRSARLVEPSVRPGGKARVEVQVESWRGKRETLRLELPIAEDLLDGRYPLHIAGGLEADRLVATRLPNRFRPVSLEDAWQRLGASRRSDALNLVLWGRASEVSVEGEDLPELPTSAVSVLAPAQQTGDRARTSTWALVHDLRQPMSTVIRGELMLEVVVDHRTP